jgi:CubicO group peptidase (beta-lactamase class C family)
VNIEERIDQIFSKWDKPDSPGCSLAVMRNGQILYQRGYGSANLEYGIPNTPQTIFHVASVSKQFTTFALLLLEQEGKLKLDDDIHQYLPKTPDFGQTITLRHLIHHTSGLRDQWELLMYAGWRMDDVITTTDILDLFYHQRELNFTPGDRYTYCNLAYTLMAVIVEKVSGQPFPQFCQERIFKPLGMNSTHFHEDLYQLVPNRAYSYSNAGENAFKNEVLSFATVGATSLFTTVQDLARWDENFYTGAVGGKHVLDQMRERFVLNNGETIKYAGGLLIDQYRGLRIEEHSGSDAGFRSHLLRFPDQHLSVAILCNLGGMTPGEYARQVADIVLETDFHETLPENPEVNPEIVENLSKFVGAYVNPETGELQHLGLRNGSLTILIGDGIPLIAEAPGCFHLAPAPKQKVIFSMDPSEQLIFQLKIGNNPPTVYISQPVFEPLLEELDRYEGEFYSPELLVTYTIQKEDQGLVLSRRKYGALPLNPINKDGFICDVSSLFGEPYGFSVQFTRNQFDQVNGFSISSGRVFHLHFNRLDPSLTEKLRRA